VSSCKDGTSIILDLYNLFSQLIHNLHGFNSQCEYRSGVARDGGPEWSEVQWDRMVRHCSAFSGMEEAPVTRRRRGGPNSSPTLGPG